jgi:hypothetical protein
MLAMGSFVCNQQMTDALHRFRVVALTALA